MLIMIEITVSNRNIQCPAMYMETQYKNYIQNT